MDQTFYIIIGMLIGITFLAGHAWKGWETVARLRHNIKASPVACEVCAVKATLHNHHTHQPGMPGNGGMMFTDTHEYLPIHLVLGDGGRHIHQESPTV